MNTFSRVLMTSIFRQIFPTVSIAVDVTDAIEWDAILDKNITLSIAMLCWIFYRTRNVGYVR